MYRSLICGTDPIKKVFATVYFFDLLLILKNGRNDWFFFPILLGRLIYTNLLFFMTD